MIEIDDILISGFEARRVIGVCSEEGYCIALLQSDIDGPINQDEENVGEFILLNDIYEP